MGLTDQYHSDTGSTILSPMMLCGGQFSVARFVDRHISLRGRLRSLRRRGERVAQAGRLPVREGSSPSWRHAMWTTESRALVGDFGAGQALSDEQYALLAPLIPPAKPGADGRARPSAYDRLAALLACFLLGLTLVIVRRLAGSTG